MIKHIYRNIADVEFDLNQDGTLNLSAGAGSDLNVTLSLEQVIALQAFFTTPNVARLIENADAVQQNASDDRFYKSMAKDAALMKRALA
jgi:hypothetical protein